MKRLPYPSYENSAACLIRHICGGFISVNRHSQTIAAVTGQAKDFFGIIERTDKRYRAKGLFLHAQHIVAGLDDNRRINQVSFDLPAQGNLCALFYSIS